MEKSLLVAFLICFMLCSYGIAGTIQFSVAQNATDTINATVPMNTSAPTQSSTLWPSETDSPNLGQNSINTIAISIAAIMIIIIIVSALMLVKIFRK